MDSSNGTDSSSSGPLTSTSATSVADSSCTANSSISSSSLASSKTVVAQETPTRSASTRGPRGRAVKNKKVKARVHLSPSSMRPTPERSILKKGSTLSLARKSDEAAVSAAPSSRSKRPSSSGSRNTPKSPGRKGRAFFELTSSQLPEDVFDDEEDDLEPPASLVVTPMADLRLEPKSSAAGKKTLPEPGAANAIHGAQRLGAHLPAGNESRIDGSRRLLRSQSEATVASLGSAPPRRTSLTDHMFNRQCGHPMQVAKPRAPQVADVPLHRVVGFEVPKPKRSASETNIMTSGKSATTSLSPTFTTTEVPRPLLELAPGWGEQPRKAPPSPSEAAERQMGVFGGAGKQVGAGHSRGKSRTLDSVSSGSVDELYWASERTTPRLDTPASPFATTPDFVSRSPRSTGQSFEFDVQELERLLTCEPTKKRTGFLLRDLGPLPPDLARPPLHAFGWPQSQKNFKRGYVEPLPATRRTAETARCQAQPPRAPCDLPPLQTAVSEGTRDRDSVATSPSEQHNLEEGDEGEKRDAAAQNDEQPQQQQQQQQKQQQQQPTSRRGSYRTANRSPASPLEPIPEVQSVVSSAQLLAALAAASLEESNAAAAAADKTTAVMITAMPRERTLRRSASIISATGPQPAGGLVSTSVVAVEVAEAQGTSYRRASMLHEAASAPSPPSYNFISAITPVLPMLRRAFTEVLRPTQPDHNSLLDRDSPKDEFQVQWRRGSCYEGQSQAALRSLTTPRRLHDENDADQDSSRRGSANTWPLMLAPSTLAPDLTRRATIESRAPLISDRW